MDFTARVEREPGWERPAGGGGAAAGAAAEEEGPEGSLQLPVSAGNPSVEGVHGVLHLYREVDRGGEIEEAEPLPSGVPPGRSDQLCILEVPAYVTVAEFCSFLGPYLPSVRHMRLVRNDARPGTYAALLHFRELDMADGFFADYEGRPFSKLEPEVCRVVYLAAVEMQEPGGGGGTVLEPLGQGGKTEMPNCPVCLERLDPHISGMVTTLCNHQFHHSCLKKYTAAACPVCRYCQDAQDAQPSCAVCGSEHDLWICLICGYVGCGRYENGHAADHWKATGHSYSMELESQRVWDYVGDNYVHRLIQSKAHGHLVEVESPGPGPSGGERWEGEKEDEKKGMQGVVLDSKMDAIALEYTSLLTSQLESQREFFEEKLAIAESSAAAAQAAADALREKAQAARVEAEELEGARKHLQKKASKLEKELLKERKERGKEVAALQQLNAMLLAKQRVHGEELRVKDEQILELEEEARDLRVFLEAQAKIAEEASGMSEISEGSVLPIPEKEPPKGRDATHSRLLAKLQK